MSLEENIKLYELVFQFGGNQIFVTVGNRSLSLSLSSLSGTTTDKPSHDLATFLQLLKYSWMFFIMVRAVLFSFFGADVAGLASCWSDRIPFRCGADCGVAGVNGNTRIQSPSDSVGLRQSLPLPHTGDMNGELHMSESTAAVVALLRCWCCCLPGPYRVELRGTDGWSCVVAVIVVVLFVAMLLFVVFRFSFHFSVAAAANAEGRLPLPLPPNRGPVADLHAIRNSDNPVLHIGSPSKSNISCNRGFFTWLSTSQSLPKAGLKLTWKKRKINDFFFLYYMF